MKQRPIIFNGEMVNAILSGNKTQMRRIIKVPTTHNFNGFIYNGPCSDKGKALFSDGGLLDYTNGIYVNPPGKVGDQLYVREAFSELVEFDFFSHDIPNPVPEFWYWADGNPGWGNWTRPKSGALMPKSASRITLEITDIRVERLQDISEQDCIAEGIGSPFTRDCKRPQFQQLWNSIYNNWNDNPFVWVISFKRI